LIQNEKIKLPKGKIVLGVFDVFDFIENHLGFSVKYVSKEHLETLSKLTTIEGHNDPSDRLIISQAITERMPLVSSDRKFPKYRKFGLNFISNFS
jgi:PIN domain nuclease of toxin-antitoxin system